MVGRSDQVLPSSTLNTVWTLRLASLAMAVIVVGFSFVVAEVVEPLREFHKEQEARTGGSRPKGAAGPLRRLTADSRGGGSEGRAAEGIPAHSSGTAERRRPTSHPPPSLASMNMEIATPMRPVSLARDRETNRPERLHREEGCSGFPKIMGLLWCS